MKHIRRLVIERGGREGGRAREREGGRESKREGGRELEREGERGERETGTRETEKQRETETDSERGERQTDRHIQIDGETKKLAVRESENVCVCVGERGRAE